MIVAGVTGGSLGTVECMDCHATGEMTCDACGTGEGDTPPAECKACEGTQIVDCETCGGEKEVRGTFWALIPPIIAIGLALITKEVYSSLFIGVLSGALLYANFSFTGSMDALIGDGLISAVSDTAGIFIFLVELGILVALVNHGGGSAAFGRWAQKHIKTRVGAMFATFVLGVLIFIDDYFNCLTVGSVMRPVAQGHKVSRAKLSYLIDATAAPICMIAPISSWAAAVSAYAEDGKGLDLFITAIPFNFYSLLTLVFVCAIIFLGYDYGAMRKHEFIAMTTGDLGEAGDNSHVETLPTNERGRVFDLIVPIATLIVASVFALLYVGGIMDGESFVDAFANTDATVGLPWGGLIALVVTVIYFVARRNITFEKAMKCVPDGFIAMVPAILILSLATALKNMTGALGAKYFVGDLMNGAAAGLDNFLPAIIFVVACVLAFATGTSWGTFGILIPIVTYLFADTPDATIMIISMSACLAGAVCGDHCSPISDTTIMSSAGADCNHINHVSTQLPYALTVAGISFVMYVIAGFVQNAWICLPIGIVLTVGTVFVLKKLGDKREAKAQVEEQAQ
ncbi:MAG: Na+/H+ antiporter NhaC family protein [Ruminococcaceae bacterium]|nr:Na+/H+ antiporter NhaC family protein [Oscillospiraceae bacterium]